MKPGTKVIDFQTGEAKKTVEVILESEAVKTAYELHVKSGLKHHKGSSWPEKNSGASMSYENAPDLRKAKTPDGEIAGGKDGKGSTIVASGLGPNVNIHGDLKDRAVVDGSASPSSAKIDAEHFTDGSTSPHETSPKIADENALYPQVFGRSFPGEK